MQLRGVCLSSAVFARASDVGKLRMDSEALTIGKLVLALQSEVSLSGRLLQFGSEDAYLWSLRRLSLRR